LSLPGGQTRPLANQGDPPKIGYSDAPLGPDYTAGAYGFDISGYAGDAYSNTPYITNFTALEQMDANTPFTVDFDTYVPGGNANQSLLFFSISDLSGTVFSTGGLPDTTTSVVIPAGTLVAGEQYTFDLLFSNRINGSTAVAGEGVHESIETTQFCDTHTDGAFSTAPGTVPEPSTWAMLLIGFAGLGLAGYRSARKTSVAATAA
jgi:PEP-CTERM motif